LFLDRLFGAEIIWGRAEEREAILKRTFEQAWEQGRRPYLIPYGGSSAVGAAAYTLAMKEVLDQVRSLPEGRPPQWIVLASSSGGTQAGLVLGARLWGFPGKILGISVDQPAPLLQEKVASLANATAELIGLPQTFTTNDILVNADYLGAGYGVMGEPEREAILRFARLEGMLLDPVYTGRAAAGLIDLIRRGFFTPSETVLFWHTGGTPALFAEQYQTNLY
jgi:1-aminocyclopropane-1-carboxylate deaminase/D-cysteine desulfhydrase-like pyridoxal-dependent ACC family enzyme